MNKAIAMLLLLGLAMPVLANCGNGGDNGNGCNGGGDGGPVGPQGQPGSNGTNGTNGVNGVDGKAGATGAQGPSHIDPRMTEARFGIDTAVRLYDGKRIQLQAYNIYSPSMHTNEDVLGDGRNLQFGVRFVFKLGASYEEELLAKQEAKITALEAMVSRLNK